MRPPTTTPRWSGHGEATAAVRQTVDADAGPARRRPQRPRWAANRCSHSAGVEYPWCPHHGWLVPAAPVRPPNAGLPNLAIKPPQRAAQPASCPTTRTRHRANSRPSRGYIGPLLPPTAHSHRHANASAAAIKRGISALEGPGRHTPLRSRWPRRERRPRANFCKTHRSSARSQQLASGQRHLSPVRRAGIGR